MSCPDHGEEWHLECDLCPFRDPSRPPATIQELSFTAKLMGPIFHDAVFNHKPLFHHLQESGLTPPPKAEGEDG